MSVYVILLISMGNKNKQRWGRNIPVISSALSSVWSDEKFPLIIPFQFKHRKL